MTIVQFVLLGAGLFSIGLYGVLTRRNAVLVLASVEVMLAAVNVNLVAFDVYLGDAVNAGQVMALFIIALAAAEVGIGIAIVLMIFRNRRSADVDQLDTMRF
jgi:NADH-quinone oxidoreductase subunit K